MLARIKRWTSGVVTGIDRLIVQVENHEALVASALSGLEDSIASAETELARVGSAGHALRERHAEACQVARGIRDNAKREPNQARALDFLRAYKRAHCRELELAQRITEHERVECRLERDLLALKGKLAELCAQRDAIEARRARADAFDVAWSGDAAAQLATTLERWEKNVAEREIKSGCLTPELAALLDELSTGEDEAALALELRRLKEEV